MKIEHLAIWVKDLDRMKLFYEKHFDCHSGEKYYNPSKEFRSYFLSFEQGCRLELMQSPKIQENKNERKSEYRGIIHFAISVGSKERVNQLTEGLRTDGYEVLGEPRTTGDGYYESVILDPEYNRIEITV